MEEDGSPSATACQTIEVPNDALTDDGDGNFSLSTSGSGAPTDAEYVVTESNGSLSAEVAPSDANQIPNSTSSTAGSWTSTPTIADLNLSDATPHVLWNVSSGDDYEAYVSDSRWYLVNTTDGTELVSTDGDGGVYLSLLRGCNLDTDSTGKLTCGTDAAGSSNSFETISVPAGTAPVADSATDTLTLTETSFLTLTGDSSTDTIDITQVTTDLGTDGLIAANAVALGTDTTNAYVADLTAGTYIDVSGGGAETANVTVTVDPTEVLDVTFAAGANASQVWTWDLSGTDPTLTAASGAFAIGGDLSLVDATPHLLWNASSGDDYEAYVFDSSWFLVNTTDGTELIQTDGGTGIMFPQLANCNTIDTDVHGLLSCGSDAGSGTVTDVGDCNGPTCFTGTEGATLTPSGGVLTIAGDAEILDASGNAHLEFDSSAGDDHEIYNDGSSGLIIANKTDKRDLVWLGDTGLQDLKMNSTSFPAGGVLFSDGTRLQHRSSQLFWDNSAYNLAIAGDLDTIPTNQSYGIQNTLTNTNLNAIGIADYLTITYNGNDPGETSGAYHEVTVKGDGTIDNGVEGSQSWVIRTQGTPATTDALRGGRHEVSWSPDSTSTTSNITGTYSVAWGLGSDSGTHNITNIYGHFIQQLNEASNLSVTNAYGIYINSDCDSVTNCYSIYSESTGDMVLSGDIVVANAAPALTFNATSGDDHELYVSNSGLYFTNTTDGTESLILEGDATVRLPRLINCDTIDTTANGTLTCGTDATSAGGSGDVTDVGDCSTGACFTSGGTGTTLTPPAGLLTVAGDLAVVDSSANAHLLLDSSSGDNWELYNHAGDLVATNTTDNTEALRISNNTSTFKGTLDISQPSVLGFPNEVKWFTASALEPLEAAESIPPLTKTTGTNIDIFSASFDATTDEGRKVTFVVPDKINTSGTVTFIFVWHSLTATRGSVQWDVRTTSTGTEGELWDAALTTTTIGCAVPQTVRQRDLCTTTNTVSTLGWAARDVISMMIYRDANASGDSMAGDAELEGVYMILPLSGNTT